MEYKAVIQRTKEDFYRFRRFHRRLRYPVMWWIGWLLPLMLAALCCACAAVMIRLRAWDWEAGLTGVGLLAILVCFLLRDRIAASVAEKRALGSGSDLVMEFDQEEIRAELDGVRETYPYSAIREGFRNGDTYYLYLDKAQAFILPKRCFVLGDPETFDQFMLRKCGVIPEE